MYEKVVKVGPNKQSYFYDSKSNRVLYGYAPSNRNCTLKLLHDKSIKLFGVDEIKTDRSGDLYVNIKNEKFIIDDGWRSELIRSGYIIYKNYDEEMIEDAEEGIKIKNLNRDNLIEALSKAHINGQEISPFRWKFSTLKDEFEYIFYIDSLSAIVNKNQTRKLNNLPFYPFIRNMDKYGCVYISVFAKRKHQSDNEPSMNFIDGIIARIIKLLGDDYKFTPNNIGTRILEFQELK